MTKSQALAKAMEILNADDILLPGYREYTIVTEWVSRCIDEVGPEQALKEIEQTKAHLIGQISLMA